LNESKNNRGGRPGISTLSGIGSAIRLTIEQNGFGDHLRPHHALAIWPEIAGEQIAAVAQAEAVRGGTLIVRAKSSVWANELTFYKPELLKKLNARLGGGSDIEDIHFQTGTPAGRRSVSRRSRDDRSAKAAAAPIPQDVAPPALPAALVDPQERLDALVARTRSILAWKREHGWVACERCEALYDPLTVPERMEAPKRGRSKRLPSSGGLCPVCITLMNR